jgi:hypothetical protein
MKYLKRGVEAEKTNKNVQVKTGGPIKLKFESASASKISL